VKRLGEKHGLNLNAYTFRHTYANDQLRRGANIADIAAALGNSVQTVASYYLHADEDTVRKMNAGR
jgi:integrase